MRLGNSSNLQARFDSFAPAAKFGSDSSVHRASAIFILVLCSARMRSTRMLLASIFAGSLLLFPSRGFVEPLWPQGQRSWKPRRVASPKLILVDKKTDKMTPLDVLRSRAEADLISLRGVAARSKSDAALKLSGVLLWAVAYVLVIQAGLAHKGCLIDRELLAYNLCWELQTCTSWSRGSPLRHVVGGVWLLLDLGVLATFLMFGNLGDSGSLFQQRSEFAAFFAAFLAVGCQLAKVDEKWLQLWKHTAWLSSAAINFCIIRLSMQGLLPVHEGSLFWLPWLFLIGDLLYVKGGWSKYRGFHRPAIRPIRFCVVTMSLLPCILAHLMHVCMVVRGHGPL